ncbi:DUF6230 family protein [Haloglycomyces albus]|uniref:DUF6230 family protein n=1 Tax=Haloglycomyces albus TaxID=526067 RepID=UPI00046D1991|nr:DUF6230 family protein [Haloglycomyces albus]
MSNDAPKGRTSWKRFGLLAGPAVAAGVTMAALTAQGAIASSFAVSSDDFKVTAESMEGEGFSQVGAIVEGSDGEQHVVAPSAIASAEIVGLCQSALIDTPLGTYTLVVEAGTDPENPVEAENLILYIDELQGNAEFGNIEVGVDAGEVDRTPGFSGTPGGFAQQSETITITDAKQNAWFVEAGTFTLNGLHMSIHQGENECY